jgi:ribosome biogenesis GTPase A
MTVQSCATNTRPAPHQALLDGLSELNTLLSRTPDAAAFLQPLQQIREQLRQHRPTILLYGNYNAGKSTLINLLLERTAAKVDDIPTTASIDEYEWCGIRLLDSPASMRPSITSS